MRYSSAEEVFKEITDKIPVFKGQTYQRIGSLGIPAKSAGSPVAVR
jgi:hypothetical protein